MLTFLLSLIVWYRQMSKENIAVVDAYLQTQWRSYVGVEPRDYRIVKRTMQEIYENKARSLAFWRIQSKYPHPEYCGELDTLKKNIASYEYSRLKVKLSIRFSTAQMERITIREQELVDTHTRSCV